ncbi:hypothetical protein PENSPDRAFT_659812 [Peniophora sp. CONT]|nr:hypothetical protein PENSPDRAFT_659812 [Peniophora sp. CONT]
MVARDVYTSTTRLSCLTNPTATDLDPSSLCFAFPVPTDKAEFRRQRDALSSCLSRDECAGFEEFMRPRALAELPSSPELVVVIGVTPAGCEALVLLQGRSMTVVTLSALNAEAVEKLHQSWLTSSSYNWTATRGPPTRPYTATRGPPTWPYSTTIRHSKYGNPYDGKPMWYPWSRHRHLWDPRQCILGGVVSAPTLPLRPQAAQTHANSVDACRRVMVNLWRMIVSPILGVINSIQHMDRDRLPHVTWCPSGLLSRLPLHAAGVYGEHHSTCAFDVVVSSYASSLATLLDATKGASDRHPVSPNVLVVTQPTTPERTPLPGATVEGTRMRNVLTQFHVASTSLDNDSATVDSVLATLHHHSWVHFACHGDSSATQSALSMYDGPLSIPGLSRALVSENAELAFLSACQKNAKLPPADLADCMLGIGFKGVVSPMWLLEDEDAPIVAEAYYTHLLELRRTGQVEPGSTGAAYALHEAVKQLRAKVGEDNFLRWATFVHRGV